MGENELTNVFDEGENDRAIVEGENVMYGTGKLAEMLGISRDMVRCHIQEFEDYFDVNYTKEGKGGHIRFPSEQFERLDMVVNLRKTKSVEEVKEILDNPQMANLFIQGGNSEQRIALLLTENSKFILESVKKMLDDGLERRTAALLEDKKELTKRNELLDQHLNEIKETNERLCEENEALREAVKKDADRIVQLQESNQRMEGLLKDVLDRLPENQKKGFFSLFKK